MGTVVLDLICASLHTNIEIQFAVFLRMFDWKSLMFHCDQMILFGVYCPCNVLLFCLRCFDAVGWVAGMATGL